VWIAILGSAGLHVGLVLLLVIGGWLRENSHTDQRSRITALLRKGKPKDPKHLPRKLPAPRAAAAKELRSKTPSAADAKQKRAAAEPNKDYSKDINAALASLTQEGGGKELEDPEGSPDGVENGTALIARLGDEYETKIFKAIKAEYSIPEVIPPRERMFLQARVLITLNRAGAIRDLTFEKRSGNDLFDSAIEAAIRRSAPFPPPPAELADEYASGGLPMNFYARSM